MFQNLELQFDELRADDDGAAFDERQIVPNDEEILANLDKDPKTASKPRIVRPRLKLDDQRLCCPRGIETIQKLFEDFKIRGKGREFDDLNEMMNKLEHWAHRLFPQMQFDDFLARLENLGSKRLVQNTLDRIRNDEAMPTSFGDDGDEFKEDAGTADYFVEDDAIADFATEFKQENDMVDFLSEAPTNNHTMDPTAGTFFDDFINDDDLIAVNIF